MQPTRSYKHETAAEALFFRNVVNGTVHQAIRVEVPDLGIEFTDNAYIGKGDFFSALIICNSINGVLFGILKIPKVSSTTMRPQT